MAQHFFSKAVSGLTLSLCVMVLFDVRRHPLVDRTGRKLVVLEANSILLQLIITISPSACGLDSKSRTLSSTKSYMHLAHQFPFSFGFSVVGHRALVQRHLEVEVSGLGRDGQPLRFTATGWKARILQHEYDHLQGLLYVDQMVKRTFRTTDNLRLPLPSGCPKPGVCLSPTCK